MSGPSQPVPETQRSIAVAHAGRGEMGDSNGDRIVSGDEALAALENNNPTQVIDSFFSALFGQELMRYSATRLLDRAMTPERVAGLNEETRARMQEISNAALREAHTDPSESGVAPILRAIERIEIPHDIARLAAAVVGPAIIVEVPDPPPPARTPVAGLVQRDGTALS